MFEGVKKRERRTRRAAGEEILSPEILWFFLHPLIRCSPSRVLTTSFTLFSLSFSPLVIMRNFLDQEFLTAVLLFVILTVVNCDKDSDKNAEEYQDKPQSKPQVISASTKRPRRRPPPLIEDVPSFKLPSRSTHCNFGNQSFEIDEKWKPSLIPGHMLTCVICECIEMENKKTGLFVPRVKCKKIMDSCPEPKCDEPHLLEGRCCKTCPGHDDDIFEADLRGKRISRKGSEGKKIYALVGKVKATTPAPVVREQRPKHFYTNTNFMDDQEDNSIIQSHTSTCQYEAENQTHVFDDGSQWKSEHVECQMCFCQVRHCFSIFHFFSSNLKVLPLMFNREESSDATT